MYVYGRWKLPQVGPVGFAQIPVAVSGSETRRQESVKVNVSVWINPVRVRTDQDDRTVNVQLNHRFITAVLTRQI